jgi:NagD protein
VRLDEARGFVFDVDGTLVHRAGAEVRLIPGARDVLERIRASGRPYVLFTNGSHVAPEAIAAELREAGLPVGDEQLLTPLRSVQTYLARFPDGPRVLPFLTEDAHRYLESVGVRLVDGRNGTGVDAVFVAQPRDVDFDELERAARAVVVGARLLTGSYVPAYAGADGPIFSRGAMLTAALAKATAARPVVVGKPSQAAVRELETRLGVPAEAVAVIGDDVALDIPLGRLGGSLTVLVRTGISAALDPGRVPEKRRPHLTLDSVADLLERL